MKRGVAISLEQANAHQIRHGFAPVIQRDSGQRTTQQEQSTGILRGRKLSKPRQNKTEREYGLILEAMKRRGEIDDYRPFGIKLEWGLDPHTGKPMVYSPDFTVFASSAPIAPDFDYHQVIKLIEVKGPHIYEKDMIRFKGCRAEWSEFQFEMHQKKSGQWSRIR